MTLIQEIYDITKKIYDELLIEPEKKERKKYIKKIDRYLNLRQKLIRQLPKELKAEDKQILNETIELQKEIDIKLNFLQKQIETDLILARKDKIIKNKYNKIPITSHGKYFDKKK